MENRIIFHVDVNNAFLSWSAVLLLKNGYKIDIRKIPSIIGGDESRRHGIVLAKSPIAKKYGIKTAETLYSARKKCKNLKIYPPNYDWYYKQSKLFHNYLKQYSPNVAKYSIDEAYIDLTGTHYIYNDYIELAYKIKNEIKEKFGFTVNVGIANNMLCAKMASDFEKPDKVHTLFDDEIKDKMWPLPIEDLFMVGKQTSKKLRELNINTIGDLAKTSLPFLQKYFKNQAEFLKNSANGINYDKVIRTEAKNPSISNSETLRYDMADREILKKILFRQTSDVARNLRYKNKYCNVVGVIYKTSSFISYSKQKKLDNPTNKTEIIYKNILDIFNSSYNDEAIRLIGVRLSDLKDSSEYQISLFDADVNLNEKDDKFQRIVDDINNKFGEDIIVPASIIKNNE